LVDKDQHVIIPSPIYQNCFKAFEQAQISCDFSPLHLVNDRWVVNLEDWEVHRQANTKAIMFCNPHNPTGTVFRRDELLSIANFCENNDLIICSDEIHAPLIIAPESHHIPIASLSPEIAKRTVTLMSLNKAFNFPGVGLGWCVCQNAAMRVKIQKSLELQAVQINSIAQLLTLVALQSGGPWLNDLLIYLRQNNQVIRQFLAKNSLIKWHKSEATFLAWLDFSELSIKDPLKDFFQSGVVLSPGRQFMSSQDGFFRLNYGVPQYVLQEALNRIKNSLAD